MLHSGDVGGKSQSNPFVGGWGFSISRSSEVDPLVTWHYRARADTPGWAVDAPYVDGAIMLHTPAGMKIRTGGDDDVVLVTPDGRTVYEAWGGAFDASTHSYSATFLVRTDLQGTGISPQDNRSVGVRAFGGSLLGGLIRCSELRRGIIRHAIAMILSPTQLRRGATVASQKVWPATSTDGGGHNAYSGEVPMGALVGIPPSVDLSGLRLSPAGLTLARAYQQYGGYVVDQADRTMFLAAVEDGCAEQVKDLQHDIRRFMPYLAIVTNNGPTYPGGPGKRVAEPPAPLAD